MTKVCFGDKVRCNHPFTVYEDDRVKASRLLINILDHIRELSATAMQPNFIMLSIRHNHPGVYARIYNLR